MTYIVSEAPLNVSHPTIKPQPFNLVIQQVSAFQHIK